jgi:hypothetical protein
MRPWLKWVWAESGCGGFLERQLHLKGELFLGFEGRKQRKKVKNKGGVGLEVVKIKYVYSFLQKLWSLSFSGCWLGEYNKGLFALVHFYFSKISKGYHDYLVFASCSMNQLDYNPSKI